MNKLDEIKEERELKFWRNRMRIAKMKNKNAVTNELKKHVSLIKNQAVKQRIEKKITAEQEANKKKNHLADLQKLINGKDAESSGEEAGDDEEGFQEESVENENEAKLICWNDQSNVYHC